MKKKSFLRVNKDFLDAGSLIWKAVTCMCLSGFITATSDPWLQKIQHVCTFPCGGLWRSFSWACDRDISPQLGPRLSGSLVSLMSLYGCNLLFFPQSERQKAALWWAPSDLCVWLNALIHWVLTDMCGQLLLFPLTVLHQYFSEAYLLISQMDSTLKSTIYYILYVSSSFVTTAGKSQHFKNSINLIISMWHRTISKS